MLVISLRTMSGPCEGTNWLSLANRYGIEPWLALANKKFRHDVARECFYCAANVVVDSMRGRCGAKHRAQRADRRSDVAESRQW